MALAHMVTAYMRPHKLEEVKSAVAVLPVTGLSISDVRGSGDNPEKSSAFAGSDIVVPLPVRSRLVVVVPPELSEQVVEAIVQAAWTGSPGDGKVFVEPVEDAVRLRTGERGLSAV
jgi:nitrogen regulatory protein P-II 1